MKIKPGYGQDFWSGLMFMAVGLFFAYYAGKYEYGSAVRMGPGYFPVWLGWMTFAIGVVVCGRSFFMMDLKVPKLSFRPLFCLFISALIFGLILRPVGLVLALFVLVVGSALGGHQFRWKEVAVLYVVMAIFSVVVFVRLLDLPFPLWPAVLMD